MILGNARILAGDGLIPKGWLRIHDRVIDAYGPGDALEPAEMDLAGRWLVPGFVDVHVHGALGHSFDEADSEDGTRAADAITRHHLGYGTTTLLASLVSAPVADLERRVRALAPRVADGTLGGIHLEIGRAHV